MDAERDRAYRELRRDIALNLADLVDYLPSLRDWLLSLRTVEEMLGPSKREVSDPMKMQRDFLNGEGEDGPPAPDA